MTAGNAAGINDAAAALVLMEAQTARSRGIEALARLVGCAQTGLDPLYMGVGPIPASQRSATACRAGQDACRSRQRKAPGHEPRGFLSEVGLIGFEPTTPTMSRWCSNQLSYSPEIW